MESLTQHQVRKVTFNDRWLQSLRKTAGGDDYRDSVTRGLIARVLPSGHVQFSMRYRTQGKQRRLVLGSYPGMKLKAARQAAHAAHSQIDAGKDPAAERAEANAERTDTIAALVTAYLDEHARPHKRSAAEDERVLDRDVLPYWRDLSVRDLTRQAIKARLRAIKKRGAPIMANRTLAVIRKMLNYAVDEDLIDANPAARIKRLAPEVERERTLEDDEIRALWRCLSNPPTTAEKPAPGRRSRRRQKRDEDPRCPVSIPLAAALKVQLLTGQRGGEVARMRWRDLTLEPEAPGQPARGWWTIPPSDTKNKRAHRVPLTADAVAIIEAQRREDADGPVWVFSGDGTGSVAARSKKAAALLSRVLGFDFRGHDLRRTAATKLGELGVRREDLSAVLNHVQGGARATHVYDRYERDPEKRIALDLWARELRRILAAEPKAGADVVSIRTRGRR